MERGLLLIRDALHEGSHSEPAIRPRVQRMLEQQISALTECITAVRAGEDVRGAVLTAREAAGLILAVMHASAVAEPQGVERMPSVMSRLLDLAVFGTAPAPPSDQRHAGPA